MSHVHELLYGTRLAGGVAVHDGEAILMGVGAKPAHSQSAWSICFKSRRCSGWLASIQLLQILVKPLSGRDAVSAGDVAPVKAGVALLGHMRRFWVPLLQIPDNSLC